MSKQEMALKWWGSLSLESKFYKVIPWLKAQNKDVTSLHPSKLTNSQILEIFEGYL